MIHVIVRGTDIFVIPLGLLTSGGVGIPVTFDFDNTWDGLTKTAVFKVSETTEDAALTENACTVPAEVLATPGETLWIGVYGINNDHSLAIPTVWGKAGYIYEGAAVPET